MFKYSTSIKWSDEDDGFIATVPELPGLSAYGKTQEQALAELKIALDAYLMTASETGLTVPPPEKNQLYSGQIRLRMPKSLHANLAYSAVNECVSLNTYIVSLLSARQGQREAMQLVRQIALTIQTNYILLASQSQAYVQTVQPNQNLDYIAEISKVSSGSFIGRN